jgi:hypothetical protein
MIDYLARFEYQAGSWTFIIMQFDKISCPVYARIERGYRGSGPPALEFSEYIVNPSFLR